MDNTNNYSECCVPDSNNKHNYLFDTCVLDKKLAQDEKNVEKCKATLFMGYRYFFTTVQEREIAGVQDRTGDYKKQTPSVNYAEILRIFEELEFGRVSCCTVFYPNFMLLDGSFRFLEETGIHEKRAEMTKAIDNNNNNHRRDAITAESAIYNNCTLVTTDKRLYNKVKLYFPYQVLYFDDFISKIQEEVGVDET